jgi:transcriptional regulator with XRE-family HTH domain
VPDGTAGRRGKGTAQEADRHVGARVRERRIMLGLTLRRLAERIGTTEQQVSKYERSLDRITAGRLHRVAEALGVGPAHFFEGLGTERPAEPEQRMMLELAGDFLNLPSRRHQEAIAELARALAEP